MDKTNIKNGINLYKINTDKFKTFTVSFYIHRPLIKEEVTLNALIPFVIKRGTGKYPDMTSLNAQFEDLYGGFFDCGIRKKGEDQVISFNFEFLAPKYVKDDPGYLDSVSSLINEVLFNPYIIDGGFSTEYVEREKENLKDYILGLINDKKEYAQIRCVSEMCKSENYSLMEHGNIEDLPNIDGKKLYNQYKEILKSSIIDVFIIGDVDASKFIGSLASVTRNDADFSYPQTKYLNKLTNVKEIKEEIDVNQGKLVMGFRTNIGYNDEDGYALTIFNSIFGSGAHSKLFNNVREKLSLCYYAYSRLEKLKGLMMVSSGVEFVNFTKAHDEILNQFEAIKNGEITDDELEIAKSSVENILLSITDNAFSLEDFYLTGAIAGQIFDVNSYIEDIKKVTTSDVVRVANKIELDTVYYLTGREA